MTENEISSTFNSILLNSRKRTESKLICPLTTRLHRKTGEAPL